MRHAYAYSASVCLVLEDAARAKHIVNDETRPWYIVNDETRPWFPFVFTGSEYCSST
jgi:hypothetical protein